MTTILRRFGLLSLGLFLIVGWSGPLPLPIADAALPLTNAIPVDENGLAGTIWAGTFDHPCAEGCRTEFTWHFLSGGKLLELRYGGFKKLMTWKVEEGWVVVDSPWHGYIDLKRKGGTLSGGARFRGGYGYGWEYELRRDP